MGYEPATVEAGVAVAEAVGFGRAADVRSAVAIGTAVEVGEVIGELDGDLPVTDTHTMVLPSPLISGDPQPRVVDQATWLSAARSLPPAVTSSRRTVSGRSSARTSDARRSSRSQSFGRDDTDRSLPATRSPPR